MPPSPTDQELKSLIEGTLGKEEQARIEALIEKNPDCMRRLDEITGFDEFCAQLPTTSPISLETSSLAKLIGKLKAGDFSRPTPEEEAFSILDSLPSGTQPGRIGDFEVTELIACGGMGIVFKGCDLKLERPVAIKALPPRIAEDPEARANFLSEARVAAALDHPNILPIHVVSEGKHTPFFAMRLVKGQTLEELVAQEGPLSKERIRNIGLQATRALVHAHQNGVIHRDIKPANLLLEDDRVWIADFGIASRDNQTQHNISGTPAFASPEQLAGKAPSAKSDLYSLGATLEFASSQPLPVITKLLGPDCPESAAEVEQLFKEKKHKYWSVILIISLLGICSLFALNLRKNNALATEPEKDFYIKGKPERYRTLQKALDATQEGDVVIVDFDGMRKLEPSELIHKNCTIRAADGKHPGFIQETFRRPMLNVRSGTTLEGLTLIRPPVPKRREQADLRAVVMNRSIGKLTLKKCRVITLQTKNSANNALIFSSAPLLIEDSTIFSGTAVWLNVYSNKKSFSVTVNNSLIVSERGAYFKTNRAPLTITLDQITFHGGPLAFVSETSQGLKFQLSNSSLTSDETIISGEDSQFTLTQNNNKHTKEQLPNLQASGYEQAISIIEEIEELKN